MNALAPPRYWFPIPVPDTRATAYLSGIRALNLPATPDEDRPGDWCGPGVWWWPSDAQTSPLPPPAELWGPDGEIAGAPLPPQLRDARPALALLRHPAAKRASPIFAATVPQAIVDLAWDEFRHAPCPDRHTVARWTGGDDEDQELCALARRVEACIKDPARRREWRIWAEDCIEGPDRFDWPVLPESVTNPLSKVIDPPIEVVIRFRED